MDAVSSRDDRRPAYVVTSHSHGGWTHQHRLPVPGSDVPLRSLIAMGLAGGLVPSPSALVVLLGAIALGRVGFGVALVGAYGAGMAMTLMAVGLLLARAEVRLRRWSEGSPRIAAALAALPIVAAGLLIAGGSSLIARSLAGL